MYVCKYIRAYHRRTRGAIDGKSRKLSPVKRYIHENHYEVGIAMPHDALHLTLNNHKKARVNLQELYFFVANLGIELRIFGLKKVGSLWYSLRGATTTSRTKSRLLLTVPKQHIYWKTEEPR